MNNKKTKQVTACLAEPEYQYVKELSDKAGMSVSGMIRFLVQHCKEQKIPSTIKLQ